MMFQHRPLFLWLFTSVSSISKRTTLANPTIIRHYTTAWYTICTTNAFLGSINRIAGLLEIAEMDEPYKCLCTEEINELKESIAYIAEKYESLN